MPNGHGSKEYGGHKYADHDRTSDCEYGCGCWMGPTRSGGPTGLDPGGVCPKNPTDGKPLGGTADYDHVVSERISNLERRVYRAEDSLRRTKPSKKKLSEDLALAKMELFKANQIIKEISRLIDNRNK